MGPATPSQNQNEHNTQSFEFKIDPKPGDSLQGGLDVLQKAFSGMFQVIKDAVGPDMLRNLEVGNWLEQLASCIDGIAQSVRETGSLPADKAGELTFFQEQFEDALTGSKFERQQSALKQRFERVTQAVDRVAAGTRGDEAQVLAETAGYFRAAAKTAIAASATRA